jgi:molybdopterin-guanine dinucleotide biosynthesis protein A
MTLSAVLLAGGESRRMGTDKATILFQGEPLWQRKIRTLRELRPEKLFVSARRQPGWKPVDTDLVLDETPSGGPLSGITATLARMETSHLVTLAIDMPFITTEDLLLLVKKVTANCGAVPMFGGRAEPLAAIYPKEAYAECAAALSSKDRSLQRLVRHLAEIGKVEIAHLSQDDAKRYRSLNTPEDLNLCAACR